MATVFNDTFVKAALGEATAKVPVWYMRQAGRSQPEYRKIKENYSLFEITHEPELCARVTRLPVEQYGVDAAILYQDIMTPLAASGVDIEIKSGIGPVIHQPIRSLQDVESLGSLDPVLDLPYVLETIRLLTQEQLSVPLIGFVGAPFTLASYLIEGCPTRTFARTKALMAGSPEVWQALMGKLKDMIITYVRAQVKAGAGAIQFFDSWVGALSRADYRRYVKPVMAEIFSDLQQPEGIPLILYGLGTSHLLSEWADLPGLDVLGVDWRVEFAEARRLAGDKVIQGNLDPALLLAPWRVIEARARAVIDQGLEAPAFIFNLGHGVMPETDPAVLKKLTDFVHHYTAEKLADKIK